MFLYLFTNPMFVSESRKVVSSFPLPDAFITALETGGWNLVDLDAVLRPDLF